MCLRQGETLSGPSSPCRDWLLAFFFRRESAFSALPIPNMHTRRRFAKPSMLCVLSFLRLFLTSLDILYGDRNETRSRFCASPHGHSVAKARGGFGKWLVRVLIPLCFWPVGGHGRSRRATFPLCCGLQWIGWIGCAGLYLDSAPVATGGNGRPESVSVPLCSQLLIDSLTGAHWIGSSGAKLWPFLGVRAFM